MIVTRARPPRHAVEQGLDDAAVSPAPRWALGESTTIVPGPAAVRARRPPAHDQVVGTERRRLAGIDDPARCLGAERSARSAVQPPMSIQPTSIEAITTRPAGGRLHHLVVDRAGARAPGRRRGARASDGQRQVGVRSSPADRAALPQEHARVPGEPRRRAGQSWAPAASASPRKAARRWTSGRGRPRRRRLGNQIAVLGRGRSICDARA